MTLKRITIITPASSPIIECCRVLDRTFSDTDRYPSLVELEVCSLGANNVRKKGEDVHERLCMDEHLPRLKALGRLLASSRRPVGSVRPVDTFGSVANAYYKDSM